MGGMAHFTGPSESIQLPAKFLKEKLPDFLSPQKVKELYKLPVEFGEQTSVAGSRTASLRINLKDAGINASAIVYYGEKDSMNFAPRKKSGTERNNSTFKEEYLWSHSQKVSTVKTGGNIVRLQKLKPHTKYYYRTIIRNDQGSIWDFDSHSFTTKP